MPEDKFLKLYSYLKENQLTDLDESTFKSIYSDINKTKEIHSYLKSQGMTDLDLTSFHSSYFGGQVKKKEATVLPSGSKEKPVQSATSVQKKQKPSESFGVKTYKGYGGTVYEGDAGKGVNKYVLKDDGWYKISYSTLPSTQPTVGVQQKQQKELFEKIDEPGRIAALNKKFNTDVKTKSGAFVGYEGKEENEYRVSTTASNEKVWEVRRKGQKEFTAISDEGSINALNKRFGADVKTLEYTEKLRESQIKRQELKNKKTFKDVDGELFDFGDSDVASFLNAKYKKYGFEVSTQGGARDIILIKAKNGNTEKFYTDNWSSDTDSDQARKLRAFLQENAFLGDIKDLEQKRATEAAETIKKMEVATNMFDPNVQVSKNIQKLRAEDEKIQKTLKAENLRDVDLANKEYEKKIAEISSIYDTKDWKEQASDVIVNYEYSTQKRISDLQNLAKSDREKEKDVAAVSEAQLKLNRDERKVYNTYLSKLNYDNKEIGRRYNKALLDAEELNRLLNNGEITKEQYDESAKQIETELDTLKGLSKDVESNNRKISLVQEQNQKNAALHKLYKETQGSVGGGLWNSFLTGLTSVLPEDLQKEVVSSLGSQMTTDEFMQSEDRWDITKAGFSVSESLGSLAASALTGGAAKAAGVGKLGVEAAEVLPFFASSYKEKMSELDDPRFKNMSDAEKVAMATIYGLGVGYLDKVSAKMGATGSIPSNIATNTIFKAIGGLGKNATADAIEYAIKSQFKKDLAAGAVKIVGGAVTEGVTEGLQSLYGTGVDLTYNLINEYVKGGSKDTNIPTEGWLKKAYDEAYLGALGGLIMSTAGSTVNGVKNGFSRNSPEWNAFAKSIITDSESRAMIITDIKSKLAQGKITKAQAQEQVDAIKNTQSILSKIPENISPEDLGTTMDLIVERSKIEKEIEGKEPALVEVQKQRISDINEQLKTISKNAVQKQTTDESVLRNEESKVGLQEMEQGDSEQEIITKESQKKQELTDEFISNLEQSKKESPETFWSVSKPFEKEDGTIDREQVLKAERDGRLIKTKSGFGLVSEDGDIKGVFKFDTKSSEKTGDKVITEAIKIGGVKLDNFELPNLMKIYERNGFKVVGRTPFNVDYAPDGWNEELHGKPDVVAMVYDPNNEISVGEKTFESYDDLISYRDSLINRREVVQKAQFTQSSKASFKDDLAKAERSRNNQAASVVKAVQKVVRSVPSAKVFIHETTEDYRRALAEREGKTIEEINASEQGREQSEGSYLSDSGELHIDLSVASERTVYHEAMHHVLAKTGRNIEAMAQAVKKAVSDSNIDVDIAALFAEDYDAKEQSEEFLVELLARLTDNENKLSPTVLQKIINAINAVSRKLIGVDVLKKGASRQEVIDFLNTVSRDMAMGTEIVDFNSLGLAGTVSVNDSTNRKKSIVGDIIRFDVNKNTKVEENVPLSRFNGKLTNTIESDRMTGGYIKDDSGSILFKFLGGVQFPVITGKWWASQDASKAKKIVTNANDNRDTDGYIYGTPMVGSEKQHMSNNDMLLATTELMKLDATSRNTRVTKSDVINLIDKAFKKKGLEAKKPIIKSAIKKSNSIADVFNELEYVLFQENDNIVDRSGNNILDSNGSKISKLTFEERKSIIETLLGNATVRDVNFPSAGNAYEAAARFAEPITGKAQKIGDIVTVMRTKGTLKHKKTDKLDEFYHKSYPYEIYAENEDGTPAEIEVFILDAAYSMRDVLPVLTKKSGEKFTWEEYLAKHGSKSEKFAEAQYNRTAKLSVASGEIKSENRKKQPSPKVEVQRKKRKAVTPETSSNYANMTEDGQGNYVFYHRSNNLLDTIDPTKYGTNPQAITSSEEVRAWRDVGGVSMFYTDNRGEAVTQGARYNHMIKVPMDKVYDFNSDPENFSEKVSGTANQKLAGVTKLANQAGYDMVVARWDNNMSRAQTTIPMYPVDHQEVVLNVVKKDFNESYESNRDLGWESEVPESKSNKVNEALMDIHNERNKNGVYDDLYRLYMEFGRYSEQDVRTLVEDSNLSDDVKNKFREAMDYKPQQSKSVRKKRKSSSAVDSAYKKYELSKRRGNSEEQAKKSAMGDLQKNDWYVSATDIEREDAVRELNSKLGVKSKKSPTTSKLMGIKDVYKLVNERVALKEKLIKENRDIKFGVKLINDLKNELLDDITSLDFKGKVSARQLKYIIKRLRSTNVLNPKKRDEFFKYMERILNDSSYLDKLAIANKTKSRISKLSKGKNIQASVANMAKLFAKVNPNTVEDIDAYQAVADMVFKAVRTTRISGAELQIKEAATIETVSRYAEKEIERAEDARKAELLDEYKDLVDSGAINDSMSVSEILNTIKALDETDNPATEQSEENRNSLLIRYASFASSISEMLANNEFEGMTKQVASKIIGMSQDVVDSLSNIELARLVESLDNMVTNKISDGVESSIREVAGKRRMEEISKTVKAKPLKTIFGSTKASRVYNELTASLPILFEKVLRSRDKALTLMDGMGFREVVRGASIASNMTNSVMTEYKNQFNKTKPNGKKFTDAFNVVERGMYAFLTRTVNKSETEQRAEFNRRAGLVRETIQVLSEGTKENRQRAQIYTEVANKLGLFNDNLSVEDVVVSVNEINKSAVEFWVNKWAENYSRLADVSASVYNSILGSDINYTPDFYKMRSVYDSGIDEDSLSAGIAGGFASMYEHTSRTRSGVLMATTSPAVLPSNRYVNLEFDSTNERAFKTAMTDVETAGAIRQLSSAMKSEGFKKIFGDSKEDMEMLKRLINRYVSEKKGKSFIDPDNVAFIDKLGSAIGSLGAVKALGTITQPIKQVLPIVMNTIMNAGFNETISSISQSIGNQEFNKWLERVGEPVNLRGMDTQFAFDSVDKVDSIIQSGSDKVINTIRTVNEFWLKAFLSKPDAYIAKASFLAYYKQGLAKYGNGEKFSFDGEINEMAAQYAQQMIDRQQNVSDSDLMGQFFKSKNTYAKVFKQVVMPFSTFVMNQKNRFYSDAMQLASKNATQGDKRAAFLSILGMTSEIATFHIVSVLLGRLWDTLAGAEDDEEEKEEKARKRREYIAVQTAQDLFSPAPFMNDLFSGAINQVIDMFGITEPTEKEIQDALDEKMIKELENNRMMSDLEQEEFKNAFIENTRYKISPSFKSDFSAYGALGIGLDKAKRFKTMLDAAKDGRYEKSFSVGNIEKTATKYINKEDKESMIVNSIMYGMYMIGALPGEFGIVSDKSFRSIDKRALSAKQVQVYEVLESILTKEELRNPKVIKAVKDGKSVDGVMEAYLTK